jgi:hypothetical protein
MRASRSSPCVSRTVFRASCPREQHHSRAFNLIPQKLRKHTFPTRVLFGVVEPRRAQKRRHSLHHYLSIPRRLHNKSSTYSRPLALPGRRMLTTQTRMKTSRTLIKATQMELPPLPMCEPIRTLLLGKVQLVSLMRVLHYHHSPQQSLSSQQSLKSQHQHSPQQSPSTQHQYFRFLRPQYRQSQDPQPKLS